MTRVIIIGAAGRMGRSLINLTLIDPELALAGAVERPGHPLLGMDAGMLVGRESCGLTLSADLAKLLPQADAIVDFSAPAVALPNARAAVAAGTAVVIGTTGLSPAETAELASLGTAGGRLVVAPNYSMGVNLLFALCRQVAATLGEEFAVEIVEMHHDQKKDAPSGTAERLGQVVAEARGWSYEHDTAHGRAGKVCGPRPRRQIGMHALRGGDVVGEHTVIFATQGERLELTHRAANRDTFAMGALRAAKFLVSAPPGCHDMAAVLGLKLKA